jgi:hypothetical protein
MIEIEPDWNSSRKAPFVTPLVVSYSCCQVALFKTTQPFISFPILGLELLPSALGGGQNHAWRILSQLLLLISSRALWLHAGDLLGGLSIEANYGGFL